MTYLGTAVLFLFIFSINYVNGGKQFLKWNNHVRNTRQTNNLPFIPKKDKSRLCPAQPETMYDAIGRRQSNLLVSPEGQGSCGSCWAFSAAHTFADQININANSRVAIFSTEHLTKCTPGSGNGNGCCGNNPMGILPYLLQTGILSATCLPYTLTDYIPRSLTREERVRFKLANPLTCPATCTGGSSQTPRQLVGYQKIERRDLLLELVRGPVYAGMVITDDSYSLQNYGCGVLSYPSYYNRIPFRFIPKRGYHSVEIVDHSSSTFTGTPFFVVKNSWDTTFGEDGYFRIDQNAPIFLYFYTFNAGGNSSSTSSNAMSTVLATESSCSILEINSTNDVLVESAAEFGLEEITNSSLVRCRGSNTVPNLRLDSVISGTQQVVEGLLFDITVRAQVIGCDATSATVRLTVMQELDQSFTLLNFNYDEVTSNDNPSPSPSASPNFSLRLYILLFLLFVSIILN